MKKKKLVKLEMSSEFLNDWLKTQTIPKAHQTIIKKEAKSIAKHFEEHGWDLDFDIMIQQLYIDLLGYNPEWLLMKTLVDTIGKPVYIHSLPNSKISLNPIDRDKNSDGLFIFRKVKVSKPKKQGKQ